MNKSSLRFIYVALVVVMASLFFTSTRFLELGKLFLLVVLSYLLLDISTARRETSVFHRFNILFAVSIVIFVLYSLFLKGDLYGHVRLEFFLGALIGLAMSLYYNPTPRRKLFLPPKPVVRKVVSKESTPKKTVKKTTTKKVASKKASSKKVAKKTTKKKSAKRVAKKTTKKKATKKVSKKKTTKKASSKRNLAADRKRISFTKDHEVAYVLRKNNKRITKKNKEALVAHGKKFKSMKSYKPHNRDSFNEYMKKYKVLSKLD